MSQREVQGVRLLYICIKIAAAVSQLCHKSSAGIKRCSVALRCGAGIHGDDATGVPHAAGSSHERPRSGGSAMLLRKAKGSSGSTMLFRNTALRCAAWRGGAARMPCSRRGRAAGGRVAGS